MDICIEDRKYEEDRLKKTFQVIEAQLVEAENEKQNAFHEAMGIRRDFWTSQPTIPESMFDLNTIVGITQNLHSIKREERREETIDISIKRLNKLKISPYFARVDFMEDECIHPDIVYIGIATLIDDDYEILIYDWRAPVCCLFYENETGTAVYNCLEGIVKGEIILKRQFSIVKGKMEYMFNSSLKIDDDILQKTLSRSSDEKMKTIINSIQREQNKVIRDESNSLLVVQGPAGSGKTSIALHRAAYILYKYANKHITAENIVIFSPNDIFNDYISGVLPELGENNIYQTTFMDYAKDLFQENLQIEDSNDQMEYILSAEKNEDYYLRKDNIEFKTSLQFAEIIKRYINYLKTEGVSFLDIKFKEWYVITAEELKSLFYNTYGKWPMEHRFKEMFEDIKDLLKVIEKERIEQVESELITSDEYYRNITAVSRLKVMKEFKELKSQIKNTLTIDAIKVYINLASNRDLLLEMSKGIDLPSNIDAIMLQALAFLEKGIIKYEDITPILYIKHDLGSNLDMSNIKYVIIDEAQDYSPFQYHIFKQIFPNAGFTILGDINQSINPYVNTLDYNIIIDIFKHKTSSIINLSKSYRSTKEISDFTRAILQNYEIEGVNRQGEKPKVMQVENEGDRLEKILFDIKNMRTAGMVSIGIICRTATETVEAYKKINQYNTFGFEINLLEKDAVKFKAGISIMPSYLAKGLEFDAVIVFDGGFAEYHEESERKLFYTVCTRALHLLHIYYIGKPSVFISEINN